MTVTLWTTRYAALAAISIAAGAAAQAHDANPLAEKVRAANSRFRECVGRHRRRLCARSLAPAASTGGAMGIHYVNGGLSQDDAVDLAKPEAVMYEPMADGTLKLVAVEYITSKGPASLEGQLFSFNSAPNRYGLGPFYELHVWAWKHNPTGTFADMNPNVSCDAMKGM